VTSTDNILTAVRKVRHKSTSSQFTYTLALSLSYINARHMIVIIFTAR